MIGRRAVAASVVIAAIVLPRDLLRDAPTICPFRRLTGLPCPSCGLTRSWQAAAHLRLRDSVGHHPLGAITFLGAVGMTLGDRSDLTPLMERREVRASAVAVWLATWFWRSVRATGS